MDDYIPNRPLMWWIDDLSHEHCGLVDHPVRGWDKMPWPDNEKCYIAIDKTEYDKRVDEIQSLQSQLKKAEKVLSWYADHNNYRDHDILGYPTGIVGDE